MAPEISDRKARPMCVWASHRSCHMCFTVLTWACHVSCSNLSYTPAVDIWAAGVTMFYLLFGKKPFRSKLKTKSTRKREFAAQIVSNSWDFPVDDGVVVSSEVRLEVAVCSNGCKPCGVMSHVFICVDAGQGFDLCRPHF